MNLGDRVEIDGKPGLVVGFAEYTIDEFGTTELCVEVQRDDSVLQTMALATRNARRIRVTETHEEYLKAERRRAARIADRIDGYDRDDLGESPDF